MGRSAYTPATAAFIAHESSSTRSSSRNSSRSESVYDDSGALCIGNEEITYGQHVARPEPMSRARVGGTSGMAARMSAIATQRLQETTLARKDGPTLWAQQSFDPDDESLPAVNERFLRPGEEWVPTSDEEILYARVTDDEEDNQEDVEMSEDGEEEEDDDDEEDECDVDDDEVEEVFDYAPGLFNLVPPEVDEVEEDDEEDDTAHGNQGYYDFPARDDRTTPEIIAEHATFDRIFGTPGLVDPTNLNVSSQSRGENRDYEEAGFSPSSAVFHSHTLPFSLPVNMEHVQMRRRLSDDRR